MKIPLPDTARRAFLIIATLFLLTSSHAARAEVITPQMRTEDARLEKPVHALVAPRITVETLLKKLSAAEGVEIVLHGSPKGPGQTEVFAILRDTPLADTLNGLCTLLSYDKARWRWTREGTAGSYRYLLWPSFGLPQLVMDVQKQMQADFEAQDTKMEAALKMTPSELKKAAQTNLNLTSLASGNELLVKQQRFLLQAFYTSFSPEERRHILQGEKLIAAIPIINTTDSHATPLQFGVEYPITKITPMLYIGTKEGTSSPCIGNWENDAMWQNRLGDLWYFGGKRQIAPLEDEVVKRPAKPLPLPAEISAEVAENNTRERFSPLWTLLWKTSEAIPLSILAVPTEPLPAGQAFFSGVYFPTEPYGMTFKELMDKLNKPAFSLRYQCRKNVLLLRDTSAPFTKRASQSN